MKKMLLPLVCGAFFCTNASFAYSVSKMGVKDINVNQEYSTLSREVPQINHEALKLALTAYKNAEHFGLVHKPVLTVIDYSLASSQQRMWIFDLSQDKLLFNTYVAHGMNSGDLYARHFSNSGKSKETSLGTYITRNTYVGSDGFSLNLQGMDAGYNNNAYSRRVVMHGAAYVSPEFVKSHGRLGRSWGCPAVEKALAKPIINTIKDGSVMFAYYPDRYLVRTSKYLAV